MLFFSDVRCVAFNKRRLTGKLTAVGWLGSRWWVVMCQRNICITLSACTKLWMATELSSFVVNIKCRPCVGWRGWETLGNVNRACTNEMDIIQIVRELNDSGDTATVDTAMRCQNWIYIFSVGAFAQLFCCDKTKICVYIYIYFRHPHIKQGLAWKIAFIVRHIKHTETISNMRATTAAAVTHHAAGWVREMWIYFWLDFAPILPNRHPHRFPPGCKAIEWIHGVDFSIVVIFVFRFVSLVLDCAELSFRLNNTP